MIDNYNKVVLFGLNASKKLSQEVCEQLNSLIQNTTGKKETIINLQNPKITKFADGEIGVEFSTSVRGKDVYVIQSTSPPVNENLMELLIFIDALKRASANKIHIIIPYFGYARQDRKAKGRQPITAKLISNMLVTAGANRIVLLDIHSSQIQGFFDIPVDDLKSSHDFAQYFLKSNIKNNLVVVSPDHGGVKRARHLTHYLPAELAVIVKKRPSPNVSEIEFVLGEVKGKDCIIIDDMIDTAGTIINAAKALKNSGANKIYIAATHSVFSNGATKKLEQLVKDKIVNKVIVTNSIELSKEKRFSGLEVISIARFLARIILTSINCQSLSQIYLQRTAELLELQKK